MSDEDLKVDTEVEVIDSIDTSNEPATHRQSVDETTQTEEQPEQQQQVELNDQLEQEEVKSNKPLLQVHEDTEEEDNESAETEAATPALVTESEESHLIDVELHQPYTQEVLADVEEYINPLSESIAADEVEVEVDNLPEAKEEVVQEDEVVLDIQTQNEQQQRNDQLDEIREQFIERTTTVPILDLQSIQQAVSNLPSVIGSKIASAVQSVKGSKIGSKETSKVGSQHESKQSTRPVSGNASRIVSKPVSRNESQQGSKQSTRPASAVGSRPISKPISRHGSQQGSKINSQRESKAPSHLSTPDMKSLYTEQELPPLSIHASNHPLHVPSYQASRRESFTNVPVAINEEVVSSTSTNISDNATSATGASSSDANGTTRNRKFDRKNLSNDILAELPISIRYNDSIYIDGNEAPLNYVHDWERWYNDCDERGYDQIKILLEDIQEDEKKYNQKGKWNRFWYKSINTAMFFLGTAVVYIQASATTAEVITRFNVASGIGTSMATLMMSVGNFANKAPHYAKTSCNLTKLRCWLENKLILPPDKRYSPYDLYAVAKIAYNTIINEAKNGLQDAGK